MIRASRNRGNLSERKLQLPPQLLRGVGLPNTKLDKTRIIHIFSIREKSKNVKFSRITEKIGIGVKCVLVYNMDYGQMFEAASCGIVGVFVS